ncbi:hypothetical protein SMICM304S_02862 [Streptomyces microflavus]
MLTLHRPRARLRAFAAAACTAALGATLLGVAGTSPAGAAPAAQPAAAPAAAEAAPTAAGDKVIGYFTNWGTYDRNYHVKNIETSGSADKLTHINYALRRRAERQVHGRVTPYCPERTRAAYARPSTSVGGVRRTTWDGGRLRGPWSSTTCARASRPAATASPSGSSGSLPGGRRLVARIRFGALLARSRHRRGPPSAAVA